MTKDQLIEILPYSRRKFWWYLNKEQRIRAVRKFLFIPLWWAREYCPVTAIAWMNTGIVYGQHFYKEAGQSMYMDKKDIDAVAIASDSTLNEIKTREQLLQATGLAK